MPKKLVVIVGSDLNKNLIRQIQDEAEKHSEDGDPVLVIGDGEKPIEISDLTPLKDITDENTFFIMLIHGNNQNVEGVSKHFIYPSQTSSPYQTA